MIIDVIDLPLNLDTELVDFLRLIAKQRKVELKDIKLEVTLVPDDSGMEKTEARLITFI